jgi:hypothetical protein
MNNKNNSKSQETNRGHSETTHFNWFARFENDNQAHSENETLNQTHHSRALFASELLQSFD